MFSSFFLIVTASVLASVHSFTFVAATPEPTAAPLNKRDDKVADGSSTDPILSTETFPYTAIPYQVNPFISSRGPQSGYNKCNDTTEGEESECQTMVMNDIVRLPF
jgi:hypothetical protein